MLFISTHLFREQQFTSASYSMEGAKVPIELRRLMIKSGRVNSESSEHATVNVIVFDERVMNVNSFSILHSIHVALPAERISSSLNGIAC